MVLLLARVRTLTRATGSHSSSNLTDNKQRITIVKDPPICIRSSWKDDFGTTSPSQLVDTCRSFSVDFSVGFGTTNTNSNLFGSQQNASTSLFGTSTATSAFGQSNKPAGFSFGATSGTNLFGQPQQSTQQTTPFGQTSSSTGNTNLFGTTPGKYIFGSGGSLAQYTVYKVS